MADDVLDLLLVLARNQVNKVDTRDDTLIHILKNITLETIDITDSIDSISLDSHPTKWGPYEQTRKWNQCTWAEE